MDWTAHKLQGCSLVFDKFAPAEQQKVNKHTKFDTNFDIQRQLEHLEYDMNRTKAQFTASRTAKQHKIPANKTLTIDKFENFLDVD